MVAVCRPPPQTVLDLHPRDDRALIRRLWRRFDRDRTQKARRLNARRQEQDLRIARTHKEWWSRSADAAHGHADDMAGDMAGDMVGGYDSGGGEGSEAAESDAASGEAEPAHSETAADSPVSDADSDLSAFCVLENASKEESLLLADRQRRACVIS